MLFSEGVKLERKKLGYSQQELATKSGVPQSTISAVESGVRKPTEDTMVMIAKGLNCSVGDLLGEVRKEPTAAGDGLDQELIDLVTGLSPQEIQRVRDFVAGLIASRAK